MSLPFGGRSHSEASRVTNYCVKWEDSFPLTFSSLAGAYGFFLGGRMLGRLPATAQLFSICSASRHPAVPSFNSELWSSLYQMHSQAATKHSLFIHITVFLEFEASTNLLVQNSSSRHLEEGRARPRALLTRPPCMSR
jgi:hypothetical protein